MDEWPVLGWSTATYLLPGGHRDEKLLILLIVFAVSACSGGSSSSSGMAPGQGLDSQTCMNDTIDANSACGHSVAPQFN